MTEGGQSQIWISKQIKNYAVKGMIEQSFMATVFLAVDRLHRSFMATASRKLSNCNCFSRIGGAE
jgi:hypothetical protein